MYATDPDEVQAIPCMKTHQPTTVRVEIPGEIFPKMYKCTSDRDEAQAIPFTLKMSQLTTDRGETFPKMYKCTSDRGEAQAIPCILKS